MAVLVEKRYVLPYYLYMVTNTNNPISITKEQESMLKEIYNYLLSYEIFPPLLNEKFFENEVLNYDKAYFNQYFISEEGRYRSQVIAEIDRIIEYGLNRARSEDVRLYSRQDWWLDYGEQDEVEAEYYYKEVLGFPEYVTLNLVESSLIRLNAKSGNNEITMEFNDPFTDARVPVRYGIITLNAFAAKMNAPRRYVEILDDGDAILYAAVSKDRVEEFILGLKNILSGSSITDKCVALAKKGYKEI